MKENPRISLIIPMYNEEKILPDTLARLSSYMAARFPGDYEILYVDDGSRDGSVALVEKHTDERTRVLRNEENHGKGYVVRQGMLAACGEIRVFTDCDLAYGEEAVGEIISFLEENPALGVAVGSRAKHPQGYAGYSFKRKSASRIYRLFLRVFCGLRLSDSQSGIKAFRAAAAEQIFSEVQTNGFAFDFEVILLGEKYGIPFGEMPVKVIGNRPGHVRLLRDSFQMIGEIRRIKKRVKKL